MGGYQSWRRNESEKTQIESVWNCVNYILSSYIIINDIKKYFKTVCSVKEIYSSQPFKETFKTSMEHSAK